jgi:phosphotransferase family enzyme
VTTHEAPAEFVKEYGNKEGCARAAANCQWLRQLSSPMRIPDLLVASETQLIFTFSPGAAARPSDLMAIAEHLGDVHGAIYRSELHRAHLGQAFIAAGGQVISGFLDRRLQAIEHRLSLGAVPSPAFSFADARNHLGDALSGPAAIYKDSNPRNFLVVAGQVPVTVDFDDVTLAPFGYDLAKLVVGMAMTYGQPSARLVGRSLALYNRAARQHHDALGQVTPEQLLTWAEIHHILTSPYLGSHGYVHSWHEMRPTANDLRARPMDEGETRWL